MLSTVFHLGYINFIIKIGTKHPYNRQIEQQQNLPEHGWAVPMESPILNCSVRHRELLNWNLERARQLARPGVPAALGGTDGKPVWAGLMAGLPRRVRRTRS